MRRLRAAALSEVELAMDIINQAKAHLRAQGIDQWQTGYPDRDCLERDVRTGKGYFLEEDGIPLGYLCVDFDGEPAYEALEGEWLTDGPYVVVHRMAVADGECGKGVAAEFLRHAEEMARERGIGAFRIDTNHDNRPLLRLLERRAAVRAELAALRIFCVAFRTDHMIFSFFIQISVSEHRPCRAWSGAAPGSREAT